MKQNVKKISLALVALGTLSSIAAAQVTPQAGGYLLRFKYTPKQKSSYKMTITSAMMKTPMAMAMSMTTTAVRGTQADVEYTVKSSGSGTSIPEQKMTATVDNRGKILKSSTPGAGQFSNLQLPEKAVKTGGTWTGSMSMNGMTATSTYKFIGLKVIGGVPCAQIAVTVSGGMAQMKVTGSGNMFIRTSDCSLQSSKMATTVNVTPPSGQGNGKPMTIKTDISINRA